MEKRGRPKLAVWKFASCDGCQLTLLNCEEELPAISERVEIAYFPEATRTMLKGPFDLSLVEGSITTQHDAERIQRVRRSSRFLVAMGACATAGGLQALRNFGNLREFAAAVYPRPDEIAALDRSSPVSEHVKVDFELRGCPISKRQLMEVIGAFLHGRRPNVPHHSLCIECKLTGTVCVMVARGVPCLGPVTQAGCGAVCPSYGRGCTGCFGPQETPNTSSLGARWGRLGASEEDIMRAFRTFNAAAEAFLKESQAREK